MLRLCERAIRLSHKRQRGTGTVIYRLTTAVM